MIKQELILVDRDETDRIISVISRQEGEKKYEIYTTQIAGVDEVIDLYNGEYAKKIKKEDMTTTLKIPMACGCLNCNFECDYWKKECDCGEKDCLTCLREKHHEI